MRQVGKEFAGHGGWSGSAAYVLSRRDAVILALVVCVPIPALALSGLAVPLPEIVQRVVASLVPFITADESVQNDTLSRASIRLAGGELAPAAVRSSPGTLDVPVRVSPGSRAATRVDASMPRPPVLRGEGGAATAASRAPASPVPARSTVRGTADTPPSTALVRNPAADTPGRPASGPPTGTGATDKPIPLKPVPVKPTVAARPAVAVGPVSVDSSVTSGANATTVSGAVSVPVAGGVSVEVTIPFATPNLPVVPTQDPAPAVTGPVNTVVQGVLGGLGGR